MSCYHPLPARFKTHDELLHDLFRYGPNSPQYKRKVIVEKEGTFLDPKLDISTGEYCEPFTVPCGKCIGCRLDYSREWANRCVIESLVYPEESSNFLTLTYNDESVPLSNIGMLSLRMDDVSVFMKNLRRYFEYHFGLSDIRFYVGSEYGGETLRPHYHLILFNCRIPDLEHIGSNFQGDEYFHSDIIEKIWGKGFVVIGRFSWNTAAYTARYVMKKRKGPDSKLEYLSFGLEPECARMSRKPGIGVEYFQEHFEDIYQNDELILPNGNTVKPPRLFDSYYKEIDPKRMAKIKSNRLRAQEIAHQAKLKHHNYTEQEYFRVQEIKKESCAKKLLRVMKDLS